MFKKVVSCLAMLIFLVAVYGQSAQKIADEAFSYYQKGEFFEAGKRFEQLTNAMLESNSTNYEQVFSLSFYGAACYKAIGIFNKAISLYKTTLDIARKTNNQQQLSSILNQLADCYRYNNQPEIALSLYAEAFEREQANGNEKILLTLKYNIAETHRALKQYEKADQLYNEALKTAENLNSQYEIAAIYTNLGENYREQGISTKAMEYYQKALPLAQTIKSDELCGVIYNNMGIIYADKGEVEKAVSNFENALKLAKKANNRSDIETISDHLAQLYSQTNNNDQSIELLLKQLKDARQYKEQEKIVNLSASIANSYKRSGNYKTAVNYYTDALAVAKSLNDGMQIASLKEKLGDTYYDMGIFDKAQKVYSEASEIYLNKNRESELASNHNRLGLVYRSWGQYAKAKKKYNEAIETAQRIGKTESLPAFYNNIGAVEYLLGNTDKALELYKKSLELNEDPSTLNNIGTIYHHKGKGTEAAKYYLKALEIDKKAGNTEKLPVRLRNIGMLNFDLGDTKTALEQLSQALNIDQQLNLNQGIIEDLEKLGMVHYKEKNYDKSIEYLKEASKRIEQLRETATGNARRDYFATTINIYEYLTSAYIRNNDIDNAFNTIEMSRSKLLAEKLSGWRARDVVTSLNYVQRNLSQDDAVLILANASFASYGNAPVLSAILVTKDNKIGIEIETEDFVANISNKYKSEIEQTVEKSRGFINTKNKTEAQEPQKEQKPDFERTIRLYRNTLTGKTDKALQAEIATQFYDLLIKPIEEKLANKKHITIMPDGMLAIIPFESFMDNQGQFLAEKLNVGYTQSMAVLDVIRERNYTENRKPMIAFGGAVYDKITYNEQMVNSAGAFAALQENVSETIANRGSVRNAFASLDMYSWDNLPGTLNEVKVIKEIVQGSEIITGKSVSEAKVKELSKSGDLEKYKIIHFATHGLVVPSMPELSSLVLSQFKEEQDGEDGYLCMEEISQLKMQADFVNLSACETGLGKIYGGEGVVGLNQAFLIGGANAISVSLWQVADESTSKFMTELYKTVETEKCSYKDAMIKVKRNFISGKYGDTYKHPYFWAPFVYYGE
jgi:tetratricopeptide (TPR) repeat protein